MRRLVPYILVFLAGLLVGSCHGANPASELQAAVADLRSVPQERWRTTRYLSFYNVPENERDSTRAVVGYVVNAVSRSSVIVSHALSGNLVRLDVGELRIPAATWESLASDREPYWHITTKAIDPTTKKVTTVYTDAGHVGLEAAKQLRDMTGSGGAIVRADWFVFRAMATSHYYNLAGVPDTSDGWYKSLGIDPKVIVELRANRGANIFRSGVTHKPRRLSRWTGPLGASWQTYDSRDDGRVETDPLRNPTFGGEYDASEHIAVKPNGLHLFGLYDGKGRRVDSVPDDIAKDDSDAAGDGRLVAAASCIRCHAESGLRPFANDLKSLTESGVDIALPAREVEALAAFNRDLTKQLERDRDDYDTAIRQATGGKLTAKELPAAFAKVIRDYAYEQVSQGQALRELGAETLAPLLASNDPYVLAVGLGKQVNRVQYDQSFAEMATLIHGARR